MVQEKNINRLMKLPLGDQQNCLSASTGQDLLASLCHHPECEGQGIFFALVSSCKFADLGKYKDSQHSWTHDKYLTKNRKIICVIFQLQTMSNMNKVMDPMKTAKTMKEFERQNMKMEMTEEMSKF